eukprot:PhM_4_TR5082/c0_g1_i1/m.15796
MDEALSRREADITRREREERILETERMTRDVNRLRVIEEQEAAYRQKYEAFLQKMNIREQDIETKKTSNLTYVGKELDRLRVLYMDVQGKINKYEQEKSVLEEKERHVIVMEADAIEAQKDAEARERALDSREQHLEARLQALSQQESDDRIYEMKIAEQARAQNTAQELVDRELEQAWRQLEEQMQLDDDSLNEGLVKLKRHQREVDEKRDQLQAGERHLLDWEARLDDKEREITRREQRARDFDRRMLERMRCELQERQSSATLLLEQ